MAEKSKKELEAENERLRLQVAKLKEKEKKKSQTFVSKNENLFADLIEFLKVNFKDENRQGIKKSRYFFDRENSKPCFKLNVFVRDLIEFRAKRNDPHNLASRISMDEGSLITFLSKGRKKRVKKLEVATPPETSKSRKP